MKFFESPRQEPQLGESVPNPEKGLLSPPWAEYVNFMDGAEKEAIEYGLKLINQRTGKEFLIGSDPKDRDQYGDTYLLRDKQEVIVGIYLVPKDKERPWQAQGTMWENYEYTTDDGKDGVYRDVMPTPMTFDTLKDAIRLFTERNPGNGYTYNPTYDFSGLKKETSRE